MTPDFAEEPLNDDSEQEIESLDELESYESQSEWSMPTEQVDEVAKRVVSDAEAGWRLDLFLAAHLRASRGEWHELGGSTVLVLGIAARDRSAELLCIHHHGYQV